MNQMPVYMKLSYYHLQSLDMLLFVLHYHTKKNVVYGCLWGVGVGVFGGLVGWCRQV